MLLITWSNLQGHHHNGDQPARRPQMTCSICGRRFATRPFRVRVSRGWIHSIARPWFPTSSPLTHALSLAVFESLSWLKKCFDIGCPLVCLTPSILSKHFRPRPPVWGVFGGRVGLGACWSGMGQFDSSPNEFLIAPH